MKLFLAVLVFLSIALVTHFRLFHLRQGFIHLALVLGIGFSIWGGMGIEVVADQLTGITLVEALVDHRQSRALIFGAGLIVGVLSIWVRRHNVQMRKRK